MENKHTSHDLAQMQSLPLDIKIRMTKERIRTWYESWCRVEIYNTKTKKTRWVAVDCREGYHEPRLYKNEEVVNVFDGAVCVSFSGGKDSTVLLHLVRSMYPDVEAVFCDTGLEYPDIRNFVKTIDNVTWIRPKMNFKEVIKTYGYPIASKEIAKKIESYKKGCSWSIKYFDDSLVNCEGKPSPYRVSKRWKNLLNAPFDVTSYCCNVMKKSPILIYQRKVHKYPFVGTLASESMLREQSWVKVGCNAFEATKPQSTPLAFWTENDILEYIRKYNVPYASVYGDIVETGKMIQRVNGEVPELKTTGCDRTGCMFCMFGCHLNNDQRFVRMKENYPIQYNYCMKPVAEGGLGLKDVIDWVNENCNTKIQY